MPRFALAPWFRRGLEAAVVAAIVAIASLAGNRLSAGGGAYPLPAGPTGALVLAPAVLALGVLTCTYPLAMAATRSDASFGALAAFLIAADLTVIFSPDRIIIGPTDVQVPGGLFVALLALGPALVGLAGGQIATLGFGRRAGAVAAILAAVVAVVVLALVTIVG
ncbi:MAG: hypothetical protein M3067_13190 [Chloroflexota bacterium]|jgi:hypothetical protein|nr:hypothetical protein [Chloroflexota bacterium]